MKKFLSVLIILSLVVTISACSKKEEPGTSTVTPTTASPTTAGQSPSTATQSPTTQSPSTASQSPSTSTQSPSTSTPKPAPSTSAYNDGTYTKKGDPWEKGQEEVTLIIKGGRINQVTLRRLDKEGKEVNYGLFDGKTHDGKLYPNLNEFRESMALKMIGRQTAQIDAISGATITTKNWITAAQRALDEARK